MKRSCGSRVGFSGLRVGRCGLLWLVAGAVRSSPDARPPSHDAHHGRAYTDVFLTQADWTGLHREQSLLFVQVRLQKSGSCP